LEAAPKHRPNKEEAVVTVNFKTASIPKVDFIAVGARILLGLVFIASGAAGFFLVNNPPPAPFGLASAFQDVFFRSHWVLFVDATELITGILLLMNRFVPLALVVFAAVLTNIFIFHITMMPAGLPAPLFLTILWFIVAWPLR